MIFVGLGSLLILIGVIWMVVIAVQTGQTTGEKALWAIVNLICQPIGGIVFYIVKKQGLIPLILIIVGYIIFAPGYYSIMSEALKICQGNGENSFTKNRLARTFLPLRATYFVGWIGFVSFDRTSLDVEYIAFYSPVFRVFVSEFAGRKLKYLSRIHSQSRARYRIRDAGVLGFKSVFKFDCQDSAAFLVYFRVRPCRARRFD